MKDNNERLLLLHRREHELRHKRSGAALIMRGGGCTALVIMLIAMVGNYSIGDVPAGAYTGAMLVDESAGGYILVAVIAFMTGIGIAAFLIKHTRTKNEHQEKEKNNDEDQ